LVSAILSVVLSLTAGMSEYAADLHRSHLGALFIISMNGNALSASRSSAGAPKRPRTSAARTRYSFTANVMPSGSGAFCSNTRSTRSALGRREIDDIILASPLKSPEKFEEKREQGVRKG
jgi:hypothetical protein